MQLLFDLVVDCTLETVNYGAVLYLLESRNDILSF